MAIKVIQLYTGSVGSRIARSLIDNPRFEIVGALVHSEDKENRDLGELLGTRQSGMPEFRLADLAVTLQPGTHYVDAPWAIDTLFTMYLTDTSPESWTLQHEDVRLEVRGARGTFRFSRLSAPDYTFRASLASGDTLGDAAARALECEKAFDPGAALLALLDERLMTSIGRADAGDRS